MCGSKADIQPATAENRRGKKKTEEETTTAEYNGLPITIHKGGHNKQRNRHG